MKINQSTFSEKTTIMNEESVGIKKYICESLRVLDL